MTVVNHLCTVFPMVMMLPLNEVRAALEAVAR